MRLTREYQSYIFHFSSFLVGASLILFNPYSSFEWPVGAASADARYIAILLPDGSDFRERCRRDWRDDCENIIKSTARDPDSLTTDLRTDLENRLKKYLKKRKITTFQIQAKSLEAEVH